jgi:hypothetical protein
MTVEDALKKPTRENFLAAVKTHAADRGATPRQPRAAVVRVTADWGRRADAGIVPCRPST